MSNLYEKYKYILLVNTYLYKYISLSNNVVIVILRREGLSCI